MPAVRGLVYVIFEQPSYNVCSFKMTDDKYNFCFLTMLTLAVLKVSETEVSDIFFILNFKPKVTLHHMFRQFYESCWVKYQTYLNSAEDLSIMHTTTAFEFILSIK